MNTPKTNPDTQSSELFDLCREVYERTGWHMSRPSFYTSDDLLEKLPVGTHLRRKKDVFHVWTLPRQERTGRYADTPLKALLKLTLALHEAGELK